jgi:hypothetical protein
MIMMKKIFAFFAGVFILASLQAQQPIVETHWLSHTDSVFHFSFFYPERWKLKLPGMTSRFFVTSPKEADNDDFLENINCIARVLEQKGFTVKMAEAAIEKSLTEKLKDFKLIKKEYSTWNKSETLEIEYTCTQKTGDKTYNIHILQRMAVINDTMFTLTFTAEVDTYKMYLPTAKKIMESLKVK